MAYGWKNIFSLRLTKSDNPSFAVRRFGMSGGVYVGEDTAMKVSAFYRGVIYIATQMAKLPWEVKNKENVVQEENIYRLINIAPNREMSAMQWRIQAIVNAIVFGNSYSEIERNLVGTPIALHPIDPRRVDSVRDTSGKLWYRVSGSGPDSAGVVQNEVFLDPYDVFKVSNLHTKDGIVGQGVVSYARDSLGIILGADRMANNLFANGGIPSGVIEHPEALSPEAAARLKELWTSENGGENSAGVAVLEEGAKFNPINMDPQALQFLESRKFGIAEIARFLGLPPTKLYDMAHSTFSNVENANLEVATDTLDSWARNLEAEADIKLLNYSFAGRYTELDLYQVFRGDMTSRATYFKNMMSVGAMTPNQIRAKEGLAPYKDGDRYYIATNNFSPADRIDEIVDAQIKSKETPAPKGQEPEEKENDGDEESDETEKALNEAAIHFLKK